jgi:hypothetical protein
MSQNLSYALIPEHRKIIDASFYYCLSRYRCGGQNACSLFTDTMGILNSVNACLTAQGLIEELNYPPDFWMGLFYENNITVVKGNPANNMSRTVGSYCLNFPYRAYSYAYFKKPPNKFNGTFTYISGTWSGHGHINATIDSRSLFILLIKRF